MDPPIFNTEYLQTYPDFFYKAPDDFLSKKNNNSRYKFFKQNLFTAGDEDQFLEFYDCSNPKDKNIKPCLNNNISCHPNVYSKQYKNLCVHNVIDTYHYISDKFKKGIFLKITDGHGKVFLPFSKADYQNEWSEKVMTNPKKFKDIYELMEYTAKIENYTFVKSRVHKNTKAWYGNNGLVRLEFPISEGDSGVNMLQDMFKTLIKERILPSCELFINKRDFPLLKKDFTESYNSFFGSRTKLLSHLYPKYAPILSMTTSDVHADIPIPTWEDWCRIAYWYDGRLFGKEYKKYPTMEEFDNIPWSSKIPTAIFRGASTGLGTKLENNIRLLISAESVKKIKDNDGIQFIDAGITKWNLRPRKHPNYPYIETIHIEEMPFGLVSPMSPLEQAKYKYILHLPGHSEAYRLSLELFSGSVVLYYPCEYQLWYFKWLEPWHHYVPLSGTLDDIYEKIKWCKDNDVKCKEIVKNARLFAEKYLSRDGVLDYLQNTLWELYNITGAIEHTNKNMRDFNKELYVFVKQKIFDSYSFFDHSKNNLLADINKIITMDTIRVSKELFSILFHYCKDRFIKDQTTIKHGKNTDISVFQFLHNKYAIKKTKKTWKEEEKFQALLGYLYINNLQKIIPNFIYTYYDFNDSEYSYIVTDYIEGITFEEFLNSEKFNFKNLIDIYIYLCLILHNAQDFCGFIHMDLFPWNIMIKETINQEAHYKINGQTIKLSNSMIPIVIDYGKSHFVYNNFHYYNTSPFYLCRLQDIISIVFSSLYIVLDKHILIESEIKKIIQIMNFFSKCEYTNKINFVSLNQIKSFLKKHKKYSKMLAEQKIGLENKSPLDFFYFLIDNKFPCNVNIEYDSVMNIHEPIWYNLSDRTLFLKNKSLENEIKSIVGFTDDENLIFTLRKFFLSMEDIWSFTPTDNKVEKYLYIYNALKIFDEIKENFSLFESTLNIKIWEKNTLDDFFKDYPQLFEISLDNFFPPMNVKLLQLPNYPTHICKSCFIKNKTSISKDIINLNKAYDYNILCMILKKYNYDFFSIYITICNPFTFNKIL